MAGQKRRKKYQRQPIDERTPIRLSKRDCTIIKAVNDCLALTSPQITTLAFGSQKRADSRLRQLFDHEYLSRHFITQIVTAPGTSPMLYTLGPMGAEVLARVFAYSSDECNFAGKQVLQWQTLQHILAIADFRVAVLRAAANTGLTIPTWHNESFFRKQPDYVELKGKRIPVYPDGYFTLQVPGKGLARFIVEVDRGTEKLDQVAKQMQIYQAYLNRGVYEKRFGQGAGLRILVITNSMRRMSNIKERVTRLGGGRVYMLTDLHLVSPESVFTEPIWLSANREKLAPLLTI